VELGLKDKTVVITGGTAGIGLAAARAFAKEGAKLAVCGRSEDKVAAITKEFAESGCPLFATTADVSEEDQLGKFAKQVKEKFGKIDVWINNAAISPKIRLIDMTSAEWDEVFRVNLRAVFLGAQLAARMMRESGGGVILNAASYAAIMPNPTSGAYAAAKAGVASLTKSLAGELAPFGIRVVAYIPGIIATPGTEVRIGKFGSQLLSQISLNRYGTIEEMADVIVFLASERASYITGTSVEVTGGKYIVQVPEAPWNWYK
jgi:NAD(P)-dependent dehydrogenase (short-subunit alcohol dehydrogenase family)